MQFSIGKKVTLIVIIMAIAIIVVGYNGYKASTDSTEAFKIATRQKFPVLLSFESLQYEAMRLRNKTNELANYWGAEIEKRAGEYDAIEKNFDSKFAVIEGYKNDGEVSKLLDEIRPVVAELKDAAKTIISQHRIRNQYNVIDEGLPVPLSSFIKEKELDHINWVRQLEQSIENNTEFKGQLDPNLCSFGKWMAEFKTDNGHIQESLEKFKEPHARLHQSAAKIDKLRAENDNLGAQRVLNTEVRPLIQKLLAIFDQEHEQYQQYYKTASVKIEKAVGDLLTLGQKLRIAVEQTSKTINSEVENYVIVTEKDSAQASVLIFIISLAALAVSFALSFIVSNGIASVIKSLLEECNKLTQAVNQGKLDIRGNAAGTNFEFRAIVQGINEIIDAFVRPINVTAEYVDRISKGDIPPKITDKYNGDFNEIKNNLNQCIDAVNLLVADAGSLVIAALEGKLGTRAEAAKHQGDFRRIVEGVNKTLDAVIGPLNVAAEYVDRISRGDIPPKITDKYNGDFNEIKNNLNLCIDSLKMLIVDDGGVVLQTAAEKDLTVRMKGEYQGVYNEMKQNINSLLENLDTAFSQVYSATEQVATVSNEISSNAQSVSQGAQSQASTVEEISASISELTKSTNDIADSAQKTNAMADETKKEANEGGLAVNNAIESMKLISRSSEQISAIIGVISEIADQTNLLALNAAIEAARAGEHGMGFAVVADEVRKLAERSSTAAKEITNLIKESASKVAEGSRLSEQAGEALKKILEGVEKTAGAIGQISAATEQQGATANEVSKAVENVASITEENASSSEQLAASSEELSGSGESLRQLIEEFKVSKLNGKKRRA